MQLNKPQPNCESGAWMVNAVLNTTNPNSTFSRGIQNYLKPKGIDVRPFFAPLTSTPPFLNYKNYSTNHWAYRIPPSSINLPCAHDITNEEIHLVSSLVGKFLEDNS